MRIAKLKPGDVVRICRLYVSGFGYVYDVCWAVVVSDDRSTDDRVFMQVFFGSSDTWHENELDVGDAVARVPEHRLPNYVCAALAKWRLTGEKTTCR